MVEYFRYWGKADPAIGGYHLAAFHALDVASVAEGILQRSPVLRQKFVALLSLDEQPCVATVSALCALHDLGKFDARFQSKAPEVVEQMGRHEWRGIVGTGHDHGVGGFVALEHWYREETGEAEGLLGKYRNVRPLFGAVCGHHGYIPVSGQPLRVEARLPWCKWDVEARKQFVADVIALYRKDGAVFPWKKGVHSATQFLLAGLCAVADWIGSQTEYDGEALFVYEREPCDLETYRVRARARAAKVLEALPVGRSEPRARSFGELFTDRDGRGLCPRDVQVVVEELAIDARPALVIVEAAMGSGKTEAALSLASRWLAAGAAAGLYIGLPTMATANGILPRIEATAARLFAADSSVQLRLAHGSARKNDLFERIRRRALEGRKMVSDSSDETEAEVVCARWFSSSKRALLAQVGVGTVDQAMLAALRVKHGFVRLFGLASSVVIIDEVHAYDAYMEVILERLVQWLGALRCPVVLLSATLPKQRRERYMSEYRRGLLLAESGESHAQAMYCKSEAYPLVTVVREDGVSELSATATHTRSLCIESVVSSTDESGRIDATDPAVVALVDAAKNGEMVVWIRNTVNDARAGYQAVLRCADERGFDGARVQLFHSRFRAIDRQRIEASVLRTFGREGIANRTGRVLVATQVVEQSLDLDFDHMLSDLSPIDLLLQRAGRLWRWGALIRRPSTAREVLRVLRPHDEALETLSFGGSGSVYDRTTLWLTADALKGVERIELPRDFRVLIERCYDEASRRSRIEQASNRAALEKAEASLANELSELRARAEKNAVRPLSNDAVDHSGNVDDDEDTVDAVTRVGRNVTFLPLWWDHENCVVRTLDGEEMPRTFDASARNAWSVLDRLLDQFVKMPEYDWDPVVRACSARGDVAEWEAWRAGCSAFLKKMRQRRVKILPMMQRPDGRFSCHVEYRQGVKKVLYDSNEGLWVEKD
jgi:CRISPR-associated endonuclease/helicase Cas3